MHQFNFMNFLRIRIKIDYLIFILIFFVGIVNFTFPLFNYIKYLLLIFCGVYILLNIKYILKEKSYFNIIFLVSALSLWGITTAPINNHLVLRNTFLSSIVYFGTLIELVFILIIAKKKGLLNSFLHIFLILYTFIYLIIFSYIFIMHFSNKIFNTVVLQNFIIGNKFTVMYFNLQFITLVWVCDLLQIKKCKKSILIFLTILNMFISMFTYCSTGIIANCILLICILLKKYLKNILRSPIFFIILFILSLSFIFWYNIITEINIISGIFNLLGENIDNLSGRKKVYDLIFNLCKNKFITGYGHGSAHEIINNFIPISDAQNGFWELVLTTGIIGALIYFIILFLPYMKKGNKIFPIYIYIFIILVISFVEISYKTTLLFFGILSILINDDKKLKKI